MRTEVISELGSPAVNGPMDRNRFYGLSRDPDAWTKHMMY